MLSEDKAFGVNKPYIDLTPLNQWNKQIEKHIGKKQWDLVSEHVASRVNHSCELCGASETTPGAMGKKAKKFIIEMRFSHDTESKIATLRRLLHVCVGCSQAIHLRQTQLQSENMPSFRSPLVGAMARLEAIHGMTNEEINQKLQDELKLWKQREDSNYPQNINIDILEDGLDRLWK